MDRKYGRCARQQEQPGSNIAILWVFLIKQFKTVQVTLVEYEIVGYLLSHIQRALME